MLFYTSIIIFFFTKVYDHENKQKNNLFKQKPKHACTNEYIPIIPAFPSERCTNPL
jgi:hypothetical protein